MNILIADLSNPLSLGNLVTLNYVKKIIKKLYPKATLRIHTSHSENKDLNITSFWNVSLSSFLLGLSNLGKLRNILKDYLKSSLIIFIGNANFKTSDNFKDLIRLIIHTLSIILASKTSGKVLIMPTSFGPFKTGFHKKIAMMGIKSANRVLVRDRRSYKLLKDHLGNKISYVKDLILFTTSEPEDKTSGNKLTIGITFKNWNSDKDQDFEKNLAGALATLPDLRNARFVPILIDNQKNKKIPEMNSFIKFQKHADTYGLKIEKSASFKTVKDIDMLINNLDFLVSLRTNSTLLAVSRALPFITFSKHEKVENLLHDLKLSKFYKETGFLSSVKGRKVFINMIVGRDKESGKLKKIRNKLQNESDAFIKEFTSIIN